MSRTPATKPTDGARNRHEVSRDLVTGGLSIAAASVLAISHFGQGGRLHADYGAEPGPALLPELLLAALAAAGVVLVLRGLLARAKTRPPEPDTAVDMAPADETSEPVWAVVVLAALIAFGLLQTAFGFGIAIAALGAVLCAALAAREGRSPPRSAAEGAVIAALLYAVFRVLLSVPLT